MPEQVQPKSDFMYKLFVDQNVKKLVDEQLVWEPLLTHQRVNAMNVRYYREQYVDIETPNDTALGRSIDPYLRAPNYRAPGADFPHANYGEPKEYNLGLYQLALEIDVPDEAQKYVEMENVILRAQQKLANSFGSKVNSILGGALTDDWSPSTVQSITCSTDWTVYTSSDCLPIKDIVDAQEKVSSVAGYSYRPGDLMISKQSFYDLRIWMAYKNLNLKSDVDIGPATIMTQLEGVKVVATDMVKRDYAVMGDFAAAGVLYEAEPLTTHQYYTDADHVSHFQAMRTFNFALTDPKAICVITNVT